MTAPPAAPTTASNSYKTIISFDEKLLLLQEYELRWRRPPSAAAVSLSVEVLAQVRQLKAPQMVPRSSPVQSIIQQDEI